MYWGDYNYFFAARDPFFILVGTAGRLLLSYCFFFFWRALRAFGGREN